ncbi:MAG: hypothetical protein OIN87_00655 [Candidatus Methanoperedens sp.]|nr:hypothetical protein [Candidatus Methanoperedens sp.]
MASKEKIIGIKDKKIIYEEKAPFSRILRLLIAVIFLILAIFIFISFFGEFFGLKNEPFEGQLIILFVVIVLNVAFLGFFKMKFRITDTGIEATMPPFNYRIRFSEIKEIRTTNIPWYVGWGLRLWGRKLAFVSMHKKAVMIEKEKGFFKALVLTTRDPDEFIKIVMGKMN